MAKSLQRKKPGYTKSGEVKIISLSIKQLTELKEKTQQNKRRAKIQRRIDLLKARPGYVEPATEEVKEVTEETQPV
jgi:putative component of toxin-antitoxin plasmid stabilization module